jgi:hypothetical protein
MGKDDESSKSEKSNSSSKEENSDEEITYKLASQLNSKKLSKKFDIKGNGKSWDTVFGTVLPKGKHKIKIKFDNIKDNGNSIVGTI